MIELPDRRTEAIPLFQKALEIKPDDENSKYNLAKTFYLLEQYEKAKNVIPLSSKYYVDELNAYIDAKLGKYDSAINQIKNLLQKREKDYLYNFLAEVYLLINDLDNAYYMAEKAIAFGRNNHKNYYIAARVYYKFGLLLKAISTLDVAIQLKEKKYNSEYIECKQLRDEINSKITPGYSDDKELIKRLTDNNSPDLKSTHKGTICKYYQSKGYGFINNEGNEIFFHISNCKFKDVNIGDKVIFQTKNTTRGINAIDIKRI
jgi:cold shock CspA family protein